MRRSASLALMSGFDSLSCFLNRVVILTIKEKALLRRMTIAVIWARMAALNAFKTLGLRRIFVSSLAALLIRSEAERVCFKVGYFFEPLGMALISRGCSLTYICFVYPVAFWIWGHVAISY